MIPSHTGDALAFSANVVDASIHKEDPNLLIASIKGHPIINSRGVLINNVLVVKIVGLATGNIDFNGSVYVEEDEADGA
ncbi:MAG: hypothetical protein ACJAWS_000281 [Oleiphilaceae bacterium]|jgi:uncharacterized protein (DUF342 family)